MGWILTGQGLHHDTAILARYAPDLCRDRFPPVAGEMALVPQVVVGVGLLAFGGIPYVLWASLPHRVRPALHVAGELGHASLGLAPLRNARRFHEQLWVALLSFGEGWHNNQSRAPRLRAARSGLVRARPELDRHFNPEILRPGVGHQGLRARQAVPYEENDTLIVEEAVA